MRRPTVRLRRWFLALPCVLAALAHVPAAYAQSTPARVLVVPFENADQEIRYEWLGEAAAVLLADELNASGVPAFTRPDRVRAYERLHLPLTASLSRATVIRVGQLIGASEVIVGSYRVTDDVLSIEAGTIRLDVGTLQPHAAEEAPLGDLFGAFERLARRLARVKGGPAREADARQPTLAAFELFVKGVRAEQPATQATFLEMAIRESPGYDRAQLALWEVRTAQGDHAAALAVARAVPSSSARHRRARFAAAVSLMHLKRHDEAFAVLNDLADEGWGADALHSLAAVLNNMGIVQLRRGATPETGHATYYLTRAADADPDPDVLFNLGYAYVLERNPQAAVYWLRECLRWNPADADAHYVLAAALQATGSAVEASRERELARQLSARYEELERRAAADKLPVPRGLERVRPDLMPSTLRAERAIVASVRREQRELAAFHLQQGRLLFEREQDRDAMAELRRAIYLSPYEASAHLLIARIHMRAGRPEDAIDALKISIWSEESVAARVALAEAYARTAQIDAARRELERALVLDPSSAEAQRLLAELGRGTSER